MAEKRATTSGKQQTRSVGSTQIVRKVGGSSDNSVNAFDFQGPKAKHLFQAFSLGVEVIVLHANQTLCYVALQPHLMHVRVHQKYHNVA